MPQRIAGKVIALGDDGSLISDIHESHLNGVPRDDAVTVRCGEHETVGIFPADHQEPASTFLAFLDGEGRLVLTIVDVPAAEMLGIRLGEEIQVVW